MIVSFTNANALTVYRTIGGMCDALLTERGATMQRLDATDLALAEAVEMLFIQGPIDSVEARAIPSGVSVTFRHRGPTPAPNTGTRQLLDAAFDRLVFDDHRLQFEIGL